MCVRALSVWWVKWNSIKDTKMPRARHAQVKLRTAYIYWLTSHVGPVTLTVGALRMIGGVGPVSSP